MVILAWVMIALFGLGGIALLVVASEKNDVNSLIVAIICLLMAFMHYFLIM